LPVSPLPSTLSAEQLPTTSRPAAVSGPLFTHFVGDVVGDLVRLPSKDTAMWLAIGLSAAAGARAVDQPLSSQMSGTRALDGVFAPGATIGGARLQIGAALATYTVGRLAKSPRVAAVGTDLVRAQILTQILTGSIKSSVRRGRPDGTQFSFPSGHTSVTFASATVLQKHFGWKVGAPAFAVASYVAASRIQEKRHFLSDVAFGATLGIIAGRTVTVGRGEARFAVAPMATAGGAGVSFSWLGAR
jgi:membrane-associated phospholipid phosphatase